MFEVGCSYNIVTLETGENYEGKWSTYEASSQYEVAAVDGPLVKLLGPDFSDSRFVDRLAAAEIGKQRKEIIINTGSLFFVRAEKIHKSTT